MQILLIHISNEKFQSWGFKLLIEQTENKLALAISSKMVKYDYIFIAEMKHANLLRGTCHGRYTELQTCVVGFCFRFNRRIYAGQIFSTLTGAVSTSGRAREQLDKHTNVFGVVMECIKWQFAILTILYRYAGKPAVDGDALRAYSDAASVSAYALDAMNWAISNGIVNGVSGSLLAPADAATRAQICAIMMRYLEN